MAPDLPRPQCVNQRTATIISPLCIHHMSKLFLRGGDGDGGLKRWSDKISWKFYAQGKSHGFSLKWSVIRSTDVSLMCVYTFQACISKNISVEINAIWQGFQTCVLISLQANKSIGVSKCIYIGMLVPVGLIAIMGNESGHTPIPKTVV